MAQAAKRILYWSPRVLGIAFAAFLSILALDVFDQPAGLMPTALALLLHLLPVAVVVAVLALVWRHERLGVILFPLLACLYVFATRGRQHWSAYILITGPLLGLGILFWCNARAHAKTPAQN